MKRRLICSEVSNKTGNLESFKIYCRLEAGRNCYAGISGMFGRNNMVYLPV